ncbi:rhodanese-like domain-containing protein [Bremerella cremea]|uniref:Rhodanese-like domain-containing protein n=1 Tax=Bremerella cremea TaxID=1031537 RepID=A0A368KTY2_9BACT|nr:rhodanese-like domain-containing protein [Bremerella cremea]RCS50521.1 rhodanese-like domain-containing protein [Bremerella cremea]
MDYRRVLPLLTILGSLAFASNVLAIDLRELKKEIEAEKAVLLDVREEVQWKKAHLVLAVPCPFSKVSMDVEARKFISPYTAVPDLKIYCFSEKGKVAVVASDMFNRVNAKVIPITQPYQDFVAAGFKEKKAGDPDYDPSIPISAP